MNKTEIVNTLKSLFSANTEELNTEMYLDIKTADNRIMRIVDLTIDSTIEEVTADGLIPVLDGEYVLEDGTTLMVANGLIVEIIEAVEEDTTTEDETPADTTEVEMAEEVVAEEPVMEDEAEEVGEYVSVEDFTNHLNEVKSMFDELKAEIEMLKADKAVAMSEVASVKEAFAAYKAEPSDKPLTKTYDYSTLSIDDKLKALRRTK